MQATAFPFQPSLLDPKNARQFSDAGESLPHNPVQFIIMVEGNSISVSPVVGFTILETGSQISVHKSGYREAF